MAGFHRDGLERRILPDVSNAEVVAPPGGRVGAVLFTRGGTLMALPFDMKRLEAAGEPYPVAKESCREPYAGSPGSTSSAGVLAWISGQDRNWQYVWRNREGKDLGASGEAGGGHDFPGRKAGCRGSFWRRMDPRTRTGVTTRLGSDTGGMNPHLVPRRQVHRMAQSRGIFPGGCQRSGGEPAAAEDGSFSHSQKLVAGWTIHHLCAGQSGHWIGRPVRAPGGGDRPRWSWRRLQRTRIRGSFRPTGIGWPIRPTNRARARFMSFPFRRIRMPVDGWSPEAAA